MSGKPRELARLNPRQDERCRTAIQTTQLCKRLNSFALGWNDPQTQRPVEMSDAQIRAALGLLRKTLPDLATTQITADGGASIFLLHLEAARATSQQLIEGKAEPAPQRETNLFDAPVPTE